MFDGAIVYKFKGKILADTIPSEGLVLSLDFTNREFNGESQSLQHLDTTITDSAGCYEFSISRGCGGSNFFGLFEETNCDERKTKSNIFIYIKCRDGEWIEDSISNIEISKHITTIPKYKYNNKCQF